MQIENSVNIQGTCPLSGLAFCPIIIPMPEMFTV